MDKFRAAEISELVLKKKVFAGYEGYLAKAYLELLEELHEVRKEVEILRDFKFRILSKKKSVNERPGITPAE
jgi:hypothetical protein